MFCGVRDCFVGANSYEIHRVFDAKASFVLKISKLLFKKVYLLSICLPKCDVKSG